MSQEPPTERPAKWSRALSAHESQPAKSHVAAQQGDEAGPGRPSASTFRPPHDLPGKWTQRRPAVCCTYGIMRDALAHHPYS